MSIFRLSQAVLDTRKCTLNGYSLDKPPHLHFIQHLTYFTINSNQSISMAVKFFLEGDDNKLKTSSPLGDVVCYLNLYK